MDYLDPKKRMQHTIVLFTGYILIAIAIAIATIVLLYQAYGFGFGKNGDVIQNGLMFFSSQPNPADVYINGKLDRVKTNSRIVVPADTYNIELRKEGYQSWQRTITVEGGRILNFDYPLLFPTQLQPVPVAAYESAPATASQSPDRRWIVIAKAGSITEFDVYDTTKPAEAPVTIALPPETLRAATTEQGIEIQEWSANNRHFVLVHRFDDTREFILVDREDPTQSQNLTRTIPAEFSELSLIDRKFDRYYLRQADGTLLRYNKDDSQTTLVVRNVLGYKSYADDMVLYATPDVTDKTKTVIRLKDGDDSFVIRRLPVDSVYLLEMTKYDGVLYVAAGASNDARLFIYKDPLKQLASLKLKAATPVQVLRLPGANYVSFSSNTQYIMTQNGTSFAVYDVKEDNAYNFTSEAPLDPPQTHATWMDGHRLTYVSNGKHYIVEYDAQNPRSLSPASPNYLPFYDRDYENTFTLSPGDNNAQRLIRTPLLTPEDQ